MQVQNYGHHNIDLHKINDLAENSDYWVGVQKFLDTIEGKEGNTLSIKQLNWLEKIVDSYEEKHEKFCK